MGRAVRERTMVLIPAKEVTGGGWEIWWGNEITGNVKLLRVMSSDEIASDKILTDFEHEYYTPGQKVALILERSIKLPVVNRGPLKNKVVARVRDKAGYLLDDAGLWIKDVWSDAQATEGSYLKKLRQERTARMAENP